jgi:DNA-binding NarL/FixJ family response regulator
LRDHDRRVAAAVLERAFPVIRIFIVDDQEAFRVGLRSLLSLEPDFEVVGEAVDGNEAVARIPRARVDVVLMDLRMPRLDGIAATRILRARDAAARILVLTTFHEDSLVEDAIRAGASGYVLKNTPSEDLAALIRLAQRGYMPFSRETATSLARPDHRPLSEEAIRALRAMPRTNRAVLRCLGLGMTNAGIAEALHLSEGTVKNYVSEILETMHFQNRLQAGIFAHGMKIGEDVD